MSGRRHSQVLDPWLYDSKATFSGQCEQSDGVYLSVAIADPAGAPHPHISGLQWRVGRGQEGTLATLPLPGTSQSMACEGWEMNTLGIWRYNPEMYVLHHSF